MEFFAYWEIYFGNKLLNDIKNSNSVENLKIKSEDLRKVLRKRIKEVILGNYQMNYLTEYDLCIHIEWMFSMQRFFKVDVRRYQIEEMPKKV